MLRRMRFFQWSKKLYPQLGYSSSQEHYKQKNLDKITGKKSIGKSLAKEFGEFGSNIGRNTDNMLGDQPSNKREFRKKRDMLGGVGLTPEKINEMFRWNDEKGNYRWDFKNWSKMSYRYS